MNIKETLRGALRRIAGVSSAASLGNAEKKRRTLPLPSIFNSYGPPGDIMPKATAYNLRRFSEIPVPRRAINCIKDRIAGMRWRIQPRQGLSIDAIPDGAERAQILTQNFHAPNPDDSFRSFCEQVVEDIIVGGFGAVEVQTSGDAQSPLLLWPVDGASIRMNLDWDGSPDGKRYMQFTDQSGTKSQIALNDDELSYIRLNPRTHTPFGLGRLEVAFETINSFLSAYRYAGRLASNSVVQYALWIQGLTPTHHERLIRWWQDEIEGTGRVPIISAETQPQVLRFAAGTDADLRLAWQEFLVRIIANAFDLPAQFLGLEQDVNRSTAGEMSDLGFRSAIVPTARLVSEYLTRDAIAKRLGWTDLEFVFTDLDAQDEMAQAQIDEILLRNGVVTVNEVRRARGLAEII